VVVVVDETDFVGAGNRPVGWNPHAEDIIAIAAMDTSGVDGRIVIICLSVVSYSCETSPFVYEYESNDQPHLITEMTMFAWS